MDRLERSLDELRILRPMSRAALLMVLAETVRRNRIHTGSGYLQVSRGAARREFQFPAGVRPTVVALDTHSVVKGNSDSVRVVHGGSLRIKKTRKSKKTYNT